MTEPRGIGVVPRALPVRDIPAPSPSVAIAGQARSHGRGSYQVDVTILSLAGKTAPLWPCSWQVPLMHMASIA
jgi:hypothetical protein